MLLLALFDYPREPSGEIGIPSQARHLNNCVSLVGITDRKSGIGTLVSPRVILDTV